MINARCCAVPREQQRSNLQGTCGGEEGDPRGHCLVWNNPANERHAALSSQQCHCLDRATLSNSVQCMELFQSRTFPGLPERAPIVVTLSLAHPCHFAHRDNLTRISRHPMMSRSIFSPGTRICSSLTRSRGYPIKPGLVFYRMARLREFQVASSHKRIPLPIPDMLLGLANFFSSPPLPSYQSLVFHGPSLRLS